MKTLVRLVRAALFVAAAGVIAPHSVLAQETPPDPVDSMPVRFGPLGLQPSVQVGNVGIETNVFNDTDHPKSDFTATVSPKLVARLHAGRMSLSYTSVIGFVYYRKYRSERSVNGTSDVRADFNLGGFQPFIGMLYEETRDRPNGEIDKRARRTQPVYSAGVAMNMGGRTSLVLTARRKDVKYDADWEFRGVDLAQTLNEHAHSGEAALRFNVSPFTTLSVVGTAQQDRFTSAPVRNADSFGIVPTIAFSPEALLGGTFGIGYRRFHTLDPELPDYGGLVMHGGIGWTVLGVTKFDVSLSRDVQYSYASETPFYVQTITGLSIAQAIVAGLDVRASASRQAMAYRAVGTAAGRTDHLESLTLGTGYRFPRNVRFGINWERARRLSAQADRQYTTRRLFAALTMGF